MERRKFGKTGLEVSVLGFGAAPIGFLDTEQAQIGLLVNGLLDRGVNFIDTAAAYPGSEEALGKAISHRRNEIVLVSKCGQAFEDLPGEAWSAEVITATVERSLRRLRTDYLDVMLLHTCQKGVLEKGEAVRALVEAKKAGKIRHAGFSGDNETVAYAAGLEDIDVIETSVNLFDQVNIDIAIPRSYERGVGVIAKRPIGNAAWKPLDQQPGMYRAYARDYRERFEKMGLKLEDYPGVEDWTELALRFTLSIPGVDTAIIGTTNPQNAERNVAIAEKGALAEDWVASIRKTFARASNRSWPGLQ